MVLMNGRTRLRRGWALASMVTVFLAAALFSAALAEAADPPIPPGFKVSASKGYTVHAIGLDGTPLGKPDEVFLLVEKRGAFVIYIAPGEVTEAPTETTIKSDLGAIGKIDVRFAATGIEKIEPSVCGGTPSRFDAGSYVGTISLRGEEGYTQADATQAAGEVRTLEEFGGCSAQLSARSRGASLSVVRRAGGAAIEFEVTKVSATSRALFEASILERSGAVRIFRGVDGTAAPATFKFDLAHKRATVRVRGFISGSATYNGTAPRTRRLSGNLNVDFPGHSNVRLAGSGSKANLTATRARPSLLARPSFLTLIP